MEPELEKSITNYFKQRFIENNEKLTHAVEQTEQDSIAMIHRKVGDVLENAKRELDKHFEQKLEEFSKKVQSIVQGVESKSGLNKGRFSWFWTK
jgi:DNA anti-recombination protein RmuC